MKKILIYLLLVAVVFSLIRSECKNQTIADLQQQLTSLSLLSPQTLPDSIVTYTVFNKRNLQIMQRIDGDSAQVLNYYIPVESTLETITTVDTIVLGELEEAQQLLAYLVANASTVEDSVKIAELEIAITHLQRMVHVTRYEYDTHGWCFEPTVGGGIDTDLDVGISAGARIYYMNNWGVGVQGMVSFPTDSLDSAEYGETISAGGFVDMRIKNWESLAIKFFGDYDFTRKHWQGGVGLNFYFR